MFPIFWSVFVAVVVYAGLTDQGVDHSVALAAALALAALSSFVFHAYLSWDGGSNVRQYHQRTKLGNKRRSSR